MEWLQHIDEETRIRNGLLNKGQGRDQEWSHGWDRRGLCELCGQ